MKICYVFKDYPCLDNSKSSGVGKYIYLLSQKLSTSHSIFIITETNQNRIFRQNNVKLFSFRRPSGFLLRKKLFKIFFLNIRNTINLLRLNHRYHFDLVEFANWEVEGFIFALICLIFHVPIKIVCRLHTGTYDIEKYNEKITFSIKFIHLIEKLFVGLPNVYLSTSSKFHASHCQINYQIKNKKITIIPLGIDLPKKKYTISAAKNTEVKIMFIGRLEKRKGIHIFMRSVPLILKELPNAVFYVVGEENSNVNVFNLMHKYIPVQFLTHLHFMGYIESSEKIKYFYEIADICVIPSLYESFGYTVLEAMSYQKTVISTKVGGIPEIISSHVNGILVPSNRSKSLCAAIVKLGHHKNLRARLAKKAYLTVKNCFSVDLLEQNTMYYYTHLLDFQKTA